MRLNRIVSALLLLSAMAAQGRAAISYSYVTDATSYSGNVGDTVTIKIYLQETLTGSSQSLITSKNGLYSAGAAINVKTANGSAAQVQNQGFTFNGSKEPDGFTGPTIAVYNQGTGSAANNLEFLEAISTTAASQNQGVTTNTGGRYFLGSQKITVGSGTTTYTLTSLNNDTINGGNSQLGQENGNTVTIPGPLNGGFDLDVSSSNPAYTGANQAAVYTFTVQVAAVPEPGSLVLMTLAASTMGAAAAWRRWRNRGMAKA
jgi:hypothetical protein